MFVTLVEVGSKQPISDWYWTF